MSDNVAHKETETEAMEFTVLWKTHRAAFTIHHPGKIAVPWVIQCCFEKKGLHFVSLTNNGTLLHPVRPEHQTNVMKNKNQALVSLDHIYLSN